MTETLCWSCKRPLNQSCTWTMCFQPVDGWKATYTIRSGGMSSWHVEECPKFLRDTTPHDRKVVYD